MTYKAGDLVYFNGGGYKGVGRILSKHNYFTHLYLVRSTQLKNKFNSDNWFVNEKNLKPFAKKVGQKYRVLRDDWGNFEIGDIVTLYHIDDDCVSYYKKDSVYNYMYDLDHNKCELEFYEDVEDVEEHKENEMFTKEDLKAGYLVKTRGGEVAHIVNTTKRGMCLNYEDGYSKIGNYNNNLTNKSFYNLDITEVYGYTLYGHHAHKFEVEDRELIWKREEVKEMTIEDIQKALGHKIKVVE